MKKLLLLLILSFFSTTGYSGCPEGSAVIRTVSADGSYYTSACATIEEIITQKEQIIIQREKAFLKKQNLTADNLDNLIAASAKLGLTSLVAIYDDDDNLLNITELIDELMSVDAKMSNEMRAVMNQVLDDLPNQPVFRFDAVLLEYGEAPVVPGAMAEWQAVAIDQMNAPTPTSLAEKEAFVAAAEAASSASAAAAYGAPTDATNAAKAASVAAASAASAADEASACSRLPAGETASYC